MVAPVHDATAVETLLERALGLVEAGEAEALYTGRDAALTRFAGSQIHQNVAEHDASLRIRIVHEGRTGVASTNRIDEDGLREAVGRAAAICQRSTPHPDLPPLAEPSEVMADGPGYAASTAEADAELRAAGAQAVIGAGDDARVETSGAFSTETSTLAVANSRGVRAAHTTTQAKLVTVMMGEGRASGYAQATASDVRQIDPRSVGEEAADKARRSAGATDLDPGDYTVILEEYAVATLLEYLSFVGFSGLALEEGRSFMELGKPVMGRNVTIWDDGRDPAGLPSTIDYEGVAKQRVELISEGVAAAVVHDTATAQRAGAASTGHGLPAPNTWGPIAWNLFMAPGSSDKDSMPAAIERGVWVTRFHYVNVVHPKKAILTGMTKDGTFLIEHGRITRPISNLRFTQSIPEAFSVIEAIGAETRLVAAEYSGINARVPALKIGRFTFTGATATEETM
ncbi:MAG: TldD/PmbA family protein [Candidatus Limnocylindria bacterium]